MLQKQKSSLIQLREEVIGCELLLRAELLTSYTRVWMDSKYSTTTALLSCEKEHEGSCQLLLLQAGQTATWLHDYIQTITDKRTPQFLLPPYSHTPFSQRAINSFTGFLGEGICSQREGEPGSSLEQQWASVQGQTTFHGQEQVLNLYSTMTGQQKVTHGRDQTTLTHRTVLDQLLLAAPRLLEAGRSILPRSSSILLGKTAIGSTSCH